MSDLIDRQQAIKAVELGITYAKLIDTETGELLEPFKDSNDELKRAVQRIKNLPSAEPTFDARDTQYNLPIGTDCISRQAAIEAAIEAADEWDGGCNVEREKLIKSYISKLPSAQPEQRYTEEELRVFKHGISLSLLSKRSAQHWRYDEDMATEIKFLERLYDKVVADMGGEQDG